MVCARKGCERPINRDDLCFHHKAKTVNFGLHVLKMMRESHTSEGEMRQDIYDGARRTGKDIRRAGVTSPTSGPLL